MSTVELKLFFESPHFAPFVLHMKLNMKLFIIFLFSNLVAFGNAGDVGVGVGFGQSSQPYDQALSKLKELNFFRLKTWSINPEFLGQVQNVYSVNMFFYLLNLGSLNLISKRGVVYTCFTEGSFGGRFIDLEALASKNIPKNVLFGLKSNVLKKRPKKWGQLKIMLVGGFL